MNIMIKSLFKFYIDNEKPFSAALWAMGITCVIPLVLLKEKTTEHFTFCPENLIF